MTPVKEIIGAMMSPSAEEVAFVEKAYGTFPEKAWIAQERLEMTIEILSADKADAHVFAPHSDSFSRHYMFSRTHGCWRLTAFTRDSL